MKVPIDTVREVEVDGMVKAVTVGLVVSEDAGLGSLINTIDVYGNSVTLVAYLVPVTSIIGWASVTVLFEVVALYSNWRSLTLVILMGDL